MTGVARALRFAPVDPQWFQAAEYHVKGLPYAFGQILGDHYFGKVWLPTKLGPLV